MENILIKIKNKLQNFNKDDDKDFFFLVANFKHLEKKLSPYKNMDINKSFQEINKILGDVFNQDNRIVEQNHIFQLLQEILWIEEIIKEIEIPDSDNVTNNNTLKKVAIGLGIGALGFAVGKAFLDANRSNNMLENTDILIIAYYLSRYDHDALFSHKISASKAIENIAKILDMKPNTLRNKRDYFDSFCNESDIETKSKRRGYQNIKLSKYKQYKKILDKYNTHNNEEVKKEVLDILNKHSG